MKRLKVLIEHFHLQRKVQRIRMYIVHGCKMVRYYTKNSYVPMEKVLLLLKEPTNVFTID